VTATPQPRDRFSDVALFRRSFAQARPFWPLLGVLVALSLLATPLALLLPMPLKVTVDSVLGDVPLPGWLDAVLPTSVAGDKGTLLLVMAFAVVAVTIAVRLQGLLEWMLSTWIGERLVLSFRGRLFGHIQNLSLGFHDARGTADSTYRVQYDAAAIQHVLQSSLPLISALVRIVAMVVVIAWIDTTLAIVALTICPALFLLTQHYRKKLRKQWSDVKAVESQAMSVVQESLGALRVVQAFGQEERERQRWYGHAHRSLLAHLRVIFAEGTFGLLIGIVTAGGTAAVLYFGVRHVMDGVLTLGALLLVMAYLAQLYEPLRDVGSRIGDLQKSLASAERAFRVLDEVPEVADRPDARGIERARGEIEFRGVSFAYGETREVLRDVSFHVAPGMRVGIAGRTGSGKTTLMSLLPRFFDPRRGAVWLDGIDLRDLKLADLRRQFSIVLQEPVLFSTTIAENIAYGRPGASREAIEAAARAAAAHEFILALPDGYETQVGERGSRLSGGERQRISLARAFLKDAPVLILDEPTSSVDVVTESAILEAMERLMHGRTTFVIAHRLATLSTCDLRLFVDGGRVRELPSGGEVAGVVLDAFDGDR
jgi:ATP-binding cassette subfamily B protein